MGYTITVRADKSVLLSENEQINKNKILFLNHPNALEEKLSILQKTSSILITKNEEWFSLETEEPIQEFVDSLKNLNFLEEDIYEKLQDLLSVNPVGNELYNAIKDHVVKDYCMDKLHYTTYSLAERCLRFLLALFTLPISIFRVHLVNEGEMGLVLRSGKPEILPPGWHVMLAPTTEFVGKKRVDEPYIQHGAMKLIRVQKGQLGYAQDTDKGRHLFLMPGFHIIRSATTKFNKFLDLKREINELDPGWLVSIRTGTEGVVYDERACLEMKKPGFHFIVPPSKLVKIISTQDSIMELPEATYESSDYVPLKIKADVFYRITNTEKVCKKIDPNLLDKYIHDTAIATLSGIIRNSTFKEIGQSSTPAYNASSSSTTHQDLNNSELSPPPYSFYSKVHDAFIRELQRHGIHNLGIDIFNIRIESLSIQDKELAKTIASQSVRFAETQAKLANMEAGNQIQEADAKQKASSRLIEAQAQATAITMQANAEAEAIKIKANAEAEAIEVTGKAQNQTLIGKWEALALGGKAVEGNLTAQQAALLLVNNEQLNGVKKIIYLPSEMTQGRIGNLINHGIFANNDNPQLNSANLLPQNTEHVFER
ncbi:SPFH domain-containing protein [Rickettsiella endosymbiont of Rhagonycha lignosa]|uniref:SPFH domain-containing protein n=1 Tax=Rickettsiella endosymbiont of Rhagonycha lignosa TaxID=3077937 RepID=UPI00313E8CCD